MADRALVAGNTTLSGWVMVTGRPATSSIPAADRTIFASVTSSRPTLDFMPNLTDLASKAIKQAIKYAERGSAELHYLQKMITSGAFGIEPPQNYAALVADIKRWGEVGMIPSLNARRCPTVAPANTAPASKLA